MKRIFLLAMLFFASYAASQVVGPGYVYYVTVAPSGNCSQGAYQQILITTGLIYTCQSGTWATVSGSSGVTSVTFTGDGTVLSSTPSTAVTTTGTLLASLATAAAGTFLSNVTGGTAAPAYNSIATYLASPAAIGGTVAAAGSFTTLATSGAATFSNSADKVGQFAILADTAAISNSEVIIASTAALAANRIQVGTTWRTYMEGASSGSGGAGTTTFKIRIGTTGTTSDTAVFTYTTSTSGTGTAIPFDLWIDITWRTVGASSTAFGSIGLVSKLNTGIVVATGLGDSLGAYTSIDTTTANLIISLSAQTSVATLSHVFHMAYAYVPNK